jgi:hypothetical protein
MGSIITLLNYAYSHTEIIAALTTISELAMMQNMRGVLTENGI